ncbi:hypothetical protein DH2020_039419 [Rehmannia glutinosa]|uniref:Uncharacterized protein n=1 Tax=Rehmannia glutinosa TaxID=99300 RepID=A0ABR0UX36_REHGL
MSSSSRETCKIETNGGITLDARIYKPAAGESNNPAGKLVVVLVHPYSVLGGFQGLMKGIARRLADRVLHLSPSICEASESPRAGPRSRVSPKSTTSFRCVIGPPKISQLGALSSLDLQQSPKPKLFVMGTRDGFTSVKQLENKLKAAAGRNQTHLIEGVSHFQMEGPDYDEQMANLIVEFISSLKDVLQISLGKLFRESISDILTKAGNE